MGCSGFAYGLLSHVTNHRYNLGNAKWILVGAVNFFKAPSHVGCIRMSSVIYKHWTFPVQGLVPKGLGQKNPLHSTTADNVAVADKANDVAVSMHGSQIFANTLLTPFWSWSSAAYLY